MVTNFRYADDIVLLVSSEAKLQELEDRLDRVSRKYSLLVKIDRTKVVASDSSVLCTGIQLEFIAVFFVLYVFVCPYIQWQIQIAMKSDNALSHPAFE